MTAIEIRHISKRYGKIRALDDISLEVDAGEIFGLIGPDGAGKTTLFRIMTTLMLPDSGSGTVCGLDIVKDYAGLRRIIGYMPGRFSLYQDLSVKENMDYFATLFGTTVRFRDYCPGKLRNHKGNIFPDRTVRRPTCRKTFRRHETEACTLLRIGAQAFRAVSG